MELEALIALMGYTNLKGESFCIADKDRKVLFVTKSFANLLGFDEDHDKIIGRNIDTLIPEKLATKEENFMVGEKLYTSCTASK